MRTGGSSLHRNRYKRRERVTDGHDSECRGASDVIMTGQNDDVSAVPPQRYNMACLPTGELNSLGELL